MGDSLRIAMWAGAAAAVLAAVCLVYLVSQNLGSRNIALATGALAGALVLLVIQLLFELHAEESTDFISAEYIRMSSPAGSLRPLTRNLVSRSTRCAL